MGRPPLGQNGATQVLTGARSVVLFNDVVIGFASGVNVSEEIMYDPVETLDHLEVREHAPTGYRVSLSCSTFRTVAQGASTDEKPGSLKEQNIFPKFEQILRLQGVTFAIQDRITGKTIMLLVNVKAASHNFNITPRGVTGENVTFVATRAYDESEQQQATST